MNLFTRFDPNAPEEQLMTLLQTPGQRLERIVSTGQSSPPGFWYDQEETEWVTLLSGEARLDTETGPVTLQPGDTLLLPAHFRHRVDYTSKEPPCIWLCLFFPEESR